MITPRDDTGQPTRERLLDAGVRLFAERGFRETTVGEIEAAAGLRPRRGALYRHFPCKEALLGAALERHLATVSPPGAALNPDPLVDRRSEAFALGAWLLAELDREEQIVRILEQDGDRLPALRDAFRQRVVDAGYGATAHVVARWMGGNADDVEVRSASVVVLGALVNYRRSTWTFGAAPFAIDQQTFLKAWVEWCARAAGATRMRPDSDSPQEPPVAGVRPLPR
jgi:AcrR family transcriptional regulator